MTYDIDAVHPAMLDMVWDECEPHIARVVERSHGELTIESAKQRIIDSNCILFTIKREGVIVAVNTVELRVMSSGLRTLYIPIVGGAELDGWMPQFLEVAKTLAKKLKCTELRGLAARPGWLKKIEQFGWQNVHMVVKCDVGE